MLLTGEYTDWQKAGGRPGASSGEEYRCAVTIDRCPKVKTWLRNVDRQANSFWLPTSKDRFYPDFVARPDDGRTLIIEYKGKHLISSDDTKEKENIGKLWAEKSRGKGIFILACEDVPEYNLEAQLKQLRLV